MHPRGGLCVPPQENIKSLVTHLVDQFFPRLEHVDYVETFKSLKLKYDQVRALEMLRLVSSSRLIAEGTSVNMRCWGNPHVPAFERLSKRIRMSQGRIVAGDVCNFVCHHVSPHAAGTALTPTCCPVPAVPGARRTQRPQQRREPRARGADGGATPSGRARPAEGRRGLLQRGALRSIVGPVPLGMISS